METIKDALDEVPPEIVADLMDIGICLAGGGALLQGWLNDFRMNSTCVYGSRKTR